MNKMTTAESNTLELSLKGDKKTLWKNFLAALDVWQMITMGKEFPVICRSTTREGIFEYVSKITTPDAHIEALFEAYELQCLYVKPLIKFAQARVAFTDTILQKLTQ